MSDRYVHFSLEGLSGGHQDNLVTLGRHLVVNAAAIDAGGGLAFGAVDMASFGPLPCDIAQDMPDALPPLAYGPLAGIPAADGEDWPAYCARSFGIQAGSPFIHWLQSAMWEKTEPSAKGAGLRIAYVLDYGVPHDHVEIAMGQAHTDYDSNGFLWEKLDIMASELTDSSRPKRKQWPKWIGAVELAQRRAEILVDSGNLVSTLVGNGIARRDEIEGCPDDEIAALEESLGAMPRSYRQVLRLIGRHAGRLVDRRELTIYGDQLGELGRASRERIFDEGEQDDDPVPDDAIFIGSRYGADPWFILSGDRADSPVFLFDGDTGKVTSVSLSVWGWVEGLVRDMRPDVRIVTPDQQFAREALDIELDELRRQIEQRRSAGMAALWTIIIGGGLILSGSIAWSLRGFFGW